MTYDSFPVMVSGDGRSPGDYLSTSKGADNKHSCNYYKVTIYLATWYIRKLLFAYVFATPIPLIAQRAYQRRAFLRNRGLYRWKSQITSAACVAALNTLPSSSTPLDLPHDDVTKWKHFPRYWPLVRGIHRWPVNSPHKGQWRRALIFPLKLTGTNIWANNPEASDLRRHPAHYDVTVMYLTINGASNTCYKWLLISNQ